MIDLFFLTIVMTSELSNLNNVLSEKKADKSPVTIIRSLVRWAMSDDATVPEQQYLWGCCCLQTKAHELNKQTHTPVNDFTYAPTEPN